MTAVGRGLRVVLDGVVFLSEYCGRFQGEPPKTGLRHREAKAVGTL